MKTILLITLMLMQFVVIAQHRIGEFMAYGNNDGLPAALFYSVYQSSDGYLWIGSSSGLIRFDGKRYTFHPGYEFNYQIAASNIVVINSAANSSNILTKAFTILIVYEE